MRVIICGGRDFVGMWSHAGWLNELHAKHGFTEVVHGDASGADTFGRRWAEMRGIPVKAFPAAWGNVGRPGALVKKRRDGKLYDALAGRERNIDMALYIECSSHCMCIAFPGGRGTAHMVRECESRDIRVVRWEP